MSLEDSLIHSANQSMLADVGFEGGNGGSSRGFITSGPTLCMMSVAKRCQFLVDLCEGKVEAVCTLAMTMPFQEDGVGEDGILVLARG